MDMKKILALLASSFLLLSGQALAQPHAAHEHGVATLDLAIVADGFEVGLDGPLANFISFEHEPSTDDQKAEVAAMVDKLARAGELFRAPAEAGCRAKTISLGSGNIPAEYFGAYAAAEGHGHEAGEGHGPEAGEDHEGDEGEAGHEHGDLEASYVFECSDPGRLTGLEIGLFGQFPALEEVEARVVGDQGQSASELTPGQTSLRW
jgi:hypothetical protein